jgi:NADPH:quinone reductase-like Zn-dependent oxidoreductase
MPRRGVKRRFDPTFAEVAPCVAVNRKIVLKDSPDVSVKLSNSATVVHMPSEIPETMCAVLLTGHGGVDKLQYREDVLVPTASDGELLIRVAAAGVNNTDINTRIGWYSKTIATSTDDAAPVADDIDGGWSGTPLNFPLIQGADTCGYVVAVGNNVDASRIGERVLVRTMQHSPSGRAFETVTMGSEMNGAFAQYVVARSSETYAVNCDWTDIQLGSIPCAYSTAENMLHRALVTSNDRLLVTGASGGVGSAVVQLAKRRGATVVAVVGAAKGDAVLSIGADQVVPRDSDLPAALGRESVDVVIDLVGGPQLPSLLDVLRRGGRYVTSGAIAGPIVELDMRTIYLKDLTLIGATFQEPLVFQNLIRYIERGEIRPLVHASYPLHAISSAQVAFLEKNFVGKLVLVPPQT